MSLFACLVLASCTAGQRSDQQLVAASESVNYALRDKVDLANYQLTSVQRNGNGVTNLVDWHSPRHPYERKLVEKLKGKQYWQACYGHKDPLTAGAMYCYFLDTSDLALLAVYRLK